MAGWQSLSGYLSHRTGGALGRLKSKRRLWFMYDESGCQLVCFNSEDESMTETPLFTVAIGTAAISLNLDIQNQFIIRCEGREHFLTADNHESMMIWLLGLQAKRDAFMKKVLPPPITDKWDMPLLRKRSDTDISPSLPPPASSDSRMRHNSTPQGSNTCHASTSRNGSVDSANNLGYHSNNSSDHDSDGVFRNNNIISSKTLSSEQKGQILLVRKRSIDLTLANQRKTSSDTELSERPRSLILQPLTEFISGLGLPLQLDDDCNANNTDDSVCFICGCHDCHGDGCPEEPLERSDNKWPEARHFLTSSLSSQSASGDSAIDHDWTARVTDMEKELMATKCELANLKNRETQYKDMIVEREAIIVDLSEMIERLQNNIKDSNKLTESNNVLRPTSPVDRKLQEKQRVLQNQNRFLNEEVRRLATRRHQEVERSQELQSCIQALEAEVEKWKRDYVYLLQSTVTIPLTDCNDDMEVNLHGGNRHKERIQALLESARKTNPGLPTFERLSKCNVHVDSHGFRHKYQDDGLLLHYICQQLHQHYTSQLASHEEHQLQWKDFLKSSVTFKRTKELKLLCRRGVPPQYRSDVWTRLVRARVDDIMKDKGPYYYSNLCNSVLESQFAARYRKQISLDLLRTMPNNVHFSSLSSDGIVHMRDILQAYCIHNPSVGYCQGMNFIVGMSLLFLDAENAFWTLVAITENYFTSNYFDQNLIGAQADQEVLKELCKDKLPRLYRHLEDIDIDLSTVTLNWFLAIFFDSVPFETLVRIWDCFLLEGPKVLFRFALAILKIHESSVLQKNDTISIMRHLKTCARLTFDVEGLMKTAFEELEPFPHRQDIHVKQAYYVNGLKEALRKKELARRAYSEREQMLEELELVPNNSLVIECAALYQQGELWLCQGQQNNAKLCKVTCNNKTTVCELGVEFDCRVVSMYALSQDIVLLGTLGWSLSAYSTLTKAKLWQIYLNDAVLAISCHRYDDQNKVFAALADGTVAILEDVCEQEPGSDVFYIPVGYCPLTAMLVVDNQLWCACGNLVYILHARTLDPMDNFTISVNPFDHILSMVYGDAGVWIAVKGSSVIELWDHKHLTCKVLFDVRDNRFPLLRKEDSCYFNQARITSILPYQNSIWIGTGEGNLIIYDLLERTKRHEDGSGSDLSHSSSPYLTSKGEMVNICEVEERVNELYFQRAFGIYGNQLLVDRSRMYLSLPDGVTSETSTDPLREREGSVDTIVNSQGSMSTEVSSETVCDRKASVDTLVSNDGQGSLGTEASSETPLEKEESLGTLVSGDGFQSSQTTELSGETHQGREGSVGALAGGSEDQSSLSAEKSVEIHEDREGSVGGLVNGNENQSSLRAEMSSETTQDKEGSVGTLVSEGGECSLSTETASETLWVREGSQESAGSGSSQNWVDVNASINTCTDNGHSLSIQDSSLGNVASEINDLCVCGDVAVDENLIPSHSGDDIGCGEGEDSHNPHCTVRNSATSCLVEASLENGHMNNYVGKDGDQLLEGRVEKAACGDGSVGRDDQSCTTENYDESVCVNGVQNGSGEAHLPVLIAGSDVCPCGEEGYDKSGKNGHQTAENNNLKIGHSGLEVSMEMGSKVTVKEPSDNPLAYNGGMEPRDGNGINGKTLDVSLLNRSTSEGSGHKLSPVNELAPPAGLGALSVSSSRQASADDSDGDEQKPTIQVMKRESSVTSMVSTNSISEALYTHELHLQAKVKISDKPIRCLVLTSHKDEPIIISCAGCYGDDEAILKWKREPNEKIWTNEPVYEVSSDPSQSKRPPYLRARFSSSSSTKSGESVDGEKAEKSTFSLLPKFGSQSSREEDSKLPFSLFN